MRQNPWSLTKCVTCCCISAAQMLRVALREANRHPISKAFALAFFLAVGKYAEMIGLIRYHLNQRRGRRPQLIEYKAP